MPPILDFQSEIVLAIKARLADKINEVHANNIWLDDAPIPFGKDAPPTQNSFTLMVDDGHFDQDWGGSTCALKETTSVIITHMQKLQLDDTKKLTQIIAAAESSMLKMKRNILSAMLVEYTEVNPDSSMFAKHPWRPKNSDGKFLWDQLHPVSYVSPKRHKDWPLLYQYIEFRFSFFWDL